jgi:hypothetical protein
MATLDSLPADQRAVLQLVLQRGRSYDEIARLLSIDRAAVRQRALTAFDILGPQTGLADQRRALITDYLLGQLPPAVTNQVRDRLAESPSERAWARVLASELAPLTENPLPEIPSPGAKAGTPEDTAVQPVASEPVAAGVADEAVEAPSAEGRGRGLLRRRSRSQGEAEAPAPPPPPVATVPAGDGDEEPRRSSRLGGVVLLTAAVVIVIIVVIALVSSGGSNHKSTSTSAAHSTSTATSTTGSTSAKVIAQINLTPPTSGSKAAGIAEVLREGATDGIAIVAQNVPPNTTKPADAYAVWLYNSPTDSHILGFVNPGVSTNGRLSTAGGLPTNASHYKQLIVTRETTAHPTTPGTIILQGNLTGVS